LKAAAARLNNQPQKGKTMNTATADTNENPRGLLETAINAARLADPQIKMDDGRTLVFVPDGYGLNDITDPQKLPARITAAITVDDRQSLTDYTNRFKDPRTIIIGDYVAGTITAPTTLN
jgi:hypothetical protein